MLDSMWFRLKAVELRRSGFKFATRCYLRIADKKVLGLKLKQFIFFQGRFAIDYNFTHRILLGHEYLSAPPLSHMSTKWDDRQVQSMLMAAAYTSHFSQRV